MPKKAIKKRRTKNYKSSIFFQKVVALSILVMFFSALLMVEPFKHRENKKNYPSHHSFSRFIYSKVLTNGPRDKKQIAITFDADMSYQMINMLQKGVVESWYNKPIIDYLESNGIQATIFFTGLWVKTYPDAAREISNNPLFEIGNHSYSHPAFTNNCYGLPAIINSEDISEIENAEHAIIQETGVIPKLFRFPGGCYDSSDLKTITSLGIIPVQWDVVSGDALNQNTQMIINNVEKRTQNGSIIVMHLNGGPYAPKTYDALIKIIPELQKRGYAFVKVTDLLESN